MGAEKVGRRYRGKGATGYEAKRAGKQKWILENQGVETLFLNGIKSVLDVPVGTGRFQYLYEKNNIKRIVGVDTSPDMLEEAKKKGITDLYLNDIRKLPFQDKEFDISVCIRLFPWFEPLEVLDAMKELARVSNIIIAGIRTKEGDAFCKSNSLWNHAHLDFLSYVDKIGYKIDNKFPIGNKGNTIYRLILCE